MTSTEPESPTTEVPPTSPMEQPKRGPGRPRKAGGPLAGNGDTTPKPQPSTDGRGPGRPSNLAKLADNLTAQFAGLGSLVFALNPTVGAILIEDAASHGQALAKLAESNPKIRKALEGSVTGSAWVGVAVAFGSTAIRITAATKAVAPAEDGPDLASAFSAFAAGGPGGK